MLNSIPTSEHLARLYYELSCVGGKCVGEPYPWPYDPGDLNELICIAADMSRHDPRLMSILVKFFYENWMKLNPVAIRSQYPKMNTPETIAVIAEFSKGMFQGQGEESYFFEYLQKGLSPVPLQFYFQNLYTPGGHLAKMAVEESLVEYKKWGFLAREAPVVDEKTRASIGKIDLSGRKNILARLFEKKGQIRVSDYLTALDHKISRQQALYDLKSTKWVKGIGRGRGAVWKMKVRTQ